MPKFGAVPPEVSVYRSWDGCAPKFVQAVLATLADPRLAGGRTEWPFETLRTPDRQAYLFGFGRTYDDGRGSVTNAQSSLYSWHGYGLAVDVVEKDGTPWDAPPEFWRTLGEVGESYGLVWGGRWSRPDLPHLQWGGCPVSPSNADRMLYASKGKDALWEKYGAV